MNKVELIGNITAQPLLRQTQQGSSLCSFTVATNRNWVTEGGERKEETEFHKVVAWGKLAELISQLAQKGSKVFIDGRIHYVKRGEGKDIQTVYEISCNDFLLL